jgi:asparagine synthase (glutamine-hydrolysing)
MLSGGLDSSTIVALARDILVEEGMPALKTYSAASDVGVKCSETSSIEAVISQGNTASKVIRPSSLSAYLNGLDNAIAVCEDSFDGAWTLLSVMLLAAQNDGGRMLLTGLDGEHSIGAPTNYIAYLLREGRFRYSWEEAKAFSQNYYCGLRSPTKIYSGMIRSILQTGVLSKLKWRFDSSKRYESILANTAMSRSFARRCNLQMRISEYCGTEHVEPCRNVQAWHEKALQAPYLTAAVERYERLSSYFGLEVRHPLFDKRLLEHSRSLPLLQKVRGGWSKYMLRKLAVSRLPASVAWRQGWDQLGWVFTKERVQQFYRDPGFPLHEIQMQLAPYLEHEGTDLVSKFSEECPEDWPSMLGIWNMYILWNSLVR